jgi:hypothetical protein
VPSDGETSVARKDKVYRRQDSIRNALLEAEQQAQRLLDADHARRR